MSSAISDVLFQLKLKFFLHHPRQPERRTKEKVLCRYWNANCRRRIRTCAKTDSPGASEFSLLKTGKKIEKKIRRIRLKEKSRNVNTAILYQKSS